MNAYIDRIYYATGGHVDNAHYYYRIVRRGDGYILNATTKLYAADTSWAASAIEMTEDGTNGSFPVTIPADMSSTTVDVIIYERIGSSPANTDDVKDQYQTKVGSIFGF